MTVETEVANLTTAVNNLTASVNVAKGTLDAKVSDAQTAEANAASHEVASLTAKNAAETAAASAVSVVQQDLSALGFDLPDNVVSIRPYNAYAFGDVAWPTVGKHSWRSEPLTTTTYLGVHSGETPARAVSGAQDGDWYWNSADGKLYKLNAGSGVSQVYRGRDADLNVRWVVGTTTGVVLVSDIGEPWMIIRGDYSYDYGTMLAVAGRPEAPITDAMMIGPLLLVASNNPTGTASGLHIIDFDADGPVEVLKSGTRYRGRHQNVAARHEAIGVFPDTSIPALVSSNINAVAATVLPNAPIKNGVPVPTIAVATDGGVSVIKHDGSVVDIDRGGYAVRDLTIHPNSNLLTINYYTGGGDAFYTVAIPAEDIDPYPSYLIGEVLDKNWSSHAQYSNLYPQALEATGDHQYALLDTTQLIRSNVFRDALGGGGEADSRAVYSVQADDHAWIGVGDVKGAFLCEQGQAGVLAGANRYTSDFSSGVDGFTGVTTATANAVGGELQVTSDGSGQYGYAEKGITGLTIGDWYSIEVSYRSDDADGFRVSFGGAFVRNTGSDNASPGNAKNERYTFQAIATNLQISGLVYSADSSAETGYISSVTLDASHPDRSANGNGLIINGSLTQDADGWVSGWDTSNYLEQPDNDDLDFGTDDFFVAGWINTDDAVAPVAALNDGATFGFVLGTYAAGQVWFATRNGSSTSVIAPMAAATNSEDVFLMGVRRNGVVELWGNGKLLGTNSGTVRDVSLVDAALGVGRDRSGNAGTASNTTKLRRVMIGAGAPSAKQIEVMANWIGDRLEGAFKDMAFVAETGVLHVLTDAYHYEVDADGAVLKSTPNTETWLKLSASRDGVVRTS